MSEYDFSFVQGDTFTQTWSYGSSLSGYTARMKIKKTPASEAVLELDNTDGLSISGSNITVTIPAADSALIEGGTYLYDIKVISGAGAVTTFRRGYVTVYPEISDAD